MQQLKRENMTELIAAVEKFHGHLCAGITIGVRMTVAALERIGISDPLGDDRKKLIVFTEIDRCASEAITCLTGCRPGKRTMKVLDYGKMAATFVNLETSKAVRLVAAARKPNDNTEQDFITMPEEELFTIQNVEVPLTPSDLPGKPLRRVQCSSCGESVMDARDMNVNGRTLCKPCAAGQNYYRVISQQKELI